MAGRSKTTFKKRQKEQTRLERRQQKAARKLERKTLKDSPGVETEDELLEAVPPVEHADEPQSPAPGME
jgi:hypothetical protein